jgi:hypothetical protein
MLAHPGRPRDDDPMNNEPPMTHESLPWRLLKMLLRGVFGTIALVFFIIEDVFWASLKPIMAWVSNLPLIRRLEAWLDQLGPIPLAALFIVPLIVVWPVKLIGLWIIAQGRVIIGSIIFGAAEFIGAALAVRLWGIGRDRLLTIAWFARAYSAITWLRALVYTWALSLPGVEPVRHFVRHLRVVVRAWMKPGAAARDV